MTLPDKFAEASKQQLATHIDFFQTLTSRMFENAERILALNLETARQLATVREPRDLQALRAQSQQQVEAVMAYSRKLFEIANKPAPEPAAAPEAAAPADDQHIDTAPPVVETVLEPVAAAPEPVPEPVVAAEPKPAPAAIAPSAHPLGEADPVPAPLITATATPIAQAVSEVLAAPLDTPHPSASPMPEAGPIVIPPIAPVDAAPAPAEASAPPPPKRTGKGSKKR